jgi:DNA-binding MarR family transcriptional regulator
MKNYALLSQLIGILEKIENQHEYNPSISLDVFAHYLRQFVDLHDEGEPASELPSSLSAMTNDQLKAIPERVISNEINKLLVLLARLIRTTAKQALMGTPLQTIEEFSYLAILSKKQSAGKSELIDLNYQEKTTGTEVIRRLIDNGLVSQFDDKLDKRSKRVRITGEGKRLLDIIFDDMNDIAELVVSPLDIIERQSLLSLLNKLTNFHQSKLDEFRSMNMEKIKDYISADGRNRNS